MKQSDRGLGPRLEERAGERSARAAGALASGGYTFGMESTRSAAFKVANMVMLVLFVVAAGLQYNDPDPLQWAAIYGLAAVACGLYAARRLPWYFAASVGAAALVWAATFAPGVIGAASPGDLVQSMKADTPQIEESREALGLLIVAAWMAALAVIARRERRPHARRVDAAGLV